MTAEGSFIIGIIALAVVYAAIIAIRGFMTTWHTIGRKTGRNGSDGPVVDAQRDKRRGR